MPVLLIAYPVLVHLAILLHESMLQWLALVCLIAAPLYPALRRRSARAWAAFLILAALLYALARAGDGAYALYLPPVVLPAMMLMFFGRTLLPGQVPLITRMAAAERGTLTPDLLSYTRGVTLLWAALFVYMVLSAILLAALAPPELWSLFTNFINYLICGALFVGEYAYRRLRFQHLPHRGFIQQIRTIAGTDYRNV